MTRTEPEPLDVLRSLVRNTSLAGRFYSSSNAIKLSGISGATMPCAYARWRGPS
jgi:hypothetical protein